MYMNMTNICEFSHVLKLPDDFDKKMEQHIALVEEYNICAGLLAPGELPSIAQRHILDSLAVLLFCEVADGSHILDFGSGGGFPGIVLACARPHANFVLAESSSKRATFLEIATKRLLLKNAEVLCGQAERTARKFDMITLRAMGPIKRTIPQGIRLLNPVGKVALWAGPQFLATAEYWQNFLAKRKACMEIRRYPTNFCGGQRFAIVLISAANTKMRE